MRACDAERGWSPESRGQQKLIYSLDFREGDYSQPDYDKHKQHTHLILCHGGITTTTTTTTTNAINNNNNDNDGKQFYNNIIVKYVGFISKLQYNII